MADLVDSMVAPVDSMVVAAAIDKEIRLTRQVCIGDIPQAGGYASSGFVLVANEISVNEAIDSLHQTRAGNPI